MKRIGLAAAALAALGNEFDSLDAIDKAAVKNEKAALESTLYRCRALVGRIGEELRKKKPEHFVDERSLADFHTSLEHAASVLEQQIRQSVENAPNPVVKGSQVRAR
jgi:predicted  nucleic acid-binding Zn-ribbon protein